MDQKTIALFRLAVMDFTEDLQNSIEMRDRKDAVGYLAERLGAEQANQIAIMCGLRDGYYHAEKVGA